jgi:hypothetical protein
VAPFATRSHGTEVATGRGRHDQGAARGEVQGREQLVGHGRQEDLGGLAGVMSAGPSSV